MKNSAPKRTSPKIRFPKRKIKFFSRFDNYVTETRQFQKLKVTIINNFILQKKRKEKEKEKEKEKRKEKEKKKKGKEKEKRINIY